MAEPVSWSICVVITWDRAGSPRSFHVANGEGIAAGYSVAFGEAGHLEVKLLDGRTVRFQPIYFEQACPCTIFVIADGSTGEVIARVNGIGLAQCDETLVIPGRAVVAGPLSFDHPDAAAQCRAYVEKRGVEYARPSSGSRTNRRNREAKDFLRALHEATEVLLPDAIEAVQDGKRAHLQTIQGQLRQLLTEQRDKNKKWWTYHPILYLAAAASDLALPVYGGSIHEAEPIASQVTRRAPGASVWTFPPSVRSVHGMEKLMDLQEYMERCAATTRTGEALTSADIVERLGSSEGPGHLDPERYEFVDLMDDTVVNDADLRSIWLVGLASCVINIGRYVLNAAGYPR